MRIKQASWFSYTLVFRFLAKTSRDELRERKVWFIVLEDERGKRGIGECAMLPGLSVDDCPDYENLLNEVCAHPSAFLDEMNRLSNWPSIRFGLEMASLSLRGANPFLLFPGPFTTGLQNLRINGLVWMNDASSMAAEAREKLRDGFSCIKLKIGAINKEDEFSILKFLRSQFSAEDLEIRVDANGAFSPDEAPLVLDELAKLKVHSIEQPIRAGQPAAMRELCRNTPVPIALDEELIGLTEWQDQKALLDFVRPQYIILKPTLIGGFSASQSWIDLAAEYETGFWITSALESNVGLNAIAQWTAGLPGNNLPQGLGTGSLYRNNIASPLEVKAGYLHYRQDRNWDTRIFET